MKRAIEVKFYVLEEEVLTKKINDEILKKFNELLEEFKGKYNKIKSFLDYPLDWGDCTQTFLKIFRKKLITDTASTTFNSKDNFEDVALKLIEPTMKESIHGEVFIETIHIVIESEINKPIHAYDKLKMEELLNVLKVYF